MSAVQPPDIARTCADEAANRAARCTVNSRRIGLVLGLEEVADGVWSIYFCSVLLARVDERDYVIRA